MRQTRCATMSSRSEARDLRWYSEPSLELTKASPRFALKTDPGTQRKVSPRSSLVPLMKRLITASLVLSSLAMVQTARAEGAVAPCGYRR